MDKYIWTYNVNGVGLEAKELCIVGDTVLGTDTMVLRILDSTSGVLMPGCYKNASEIAKELSSWGGVIVPLTTPESDLLRKYIQTYGELNEEEDGDER